MTTHGIGHNKPPKERRVRSVECRECGSAFKTTHVTKCFCDASCRVAFNNRRMTRGMEVYDFLMAQRFERADGNEARGILQALATGYRDQDKEARNSRVSWCPFREAVNNLPRLPAVADGR